MGHSHHSAQGALAHPRPSALRGAAAAAAGSRTVRLFLTAQERQRERTDAEATRQAAVRAVQEAEEASRRQAQELHADASEAAAREAALGAVRGLGSTRRGPSLPPRP